MSDRACLTVAVRTRDSKRVKCLAEDWPRVSISGHHHPLRWWEKWDSTQMACLLDLQLNKHHEEGKDKWQMHPVCFPVALFPKMHPAIFALIFSVRLWGLVPCHQILHIIVPSFCPVLQLPLAMSVFLTWYASLEFMNQALLRPWDPEKFF